MGKSDVYQAQKIEQEIYQNCTIGITTTNNGKEYLINHYHIDDKKIEIIPINQDILDNFLLHFPAMTAHPK